MNYKSIKNLDISNGLGVRVSIFFTGCNSHCKSCFNSNLWDFNSGYKFTNKTKELLFKYLSNSVIKGLSILGGEPLDQGEELLCLLRNIREQFPDKDIWIWTGYKLCNLNKLQNNIIELCNFVIDGQFKENLKNKNLLFRGSSNQIIYKNVNNKFIIDEKLMNNPKD